MTAKANKRILIAEDDQFLNKMYRLNLEQDGWDVEIVANGALAIEEIEKAEPDILLLDLLMPKVDGFAVLEHIRNNKYNFPVIILSNLSQEIDQTKCMELGARDYFVKSDMDLEDLTGKINKYF